MADSKISHPDIHHKQFDRGFEMTITILTQAQSLGENSLKEDLINED